MLSLKCTKIENNPERREAILWTKDNDDNTPAVMTLTRTHSAIDLIAVSLFDRNNQKMLYEFDEGIFVIDMGLGHDGDFLVRKLMIRYRTMEKHR